MKRLLFFLLATIFLTSCSRYIDTNTNTFADITKIPGGFPYGSSFVIQAEQDENPLFSREVANKIAELLTFSGYRVTNNKSADYVLTFNFGMTSETRIVNVPTYIPGPTETTVGKIDSKDGRVSYEEKTERGGSVIFTPEAVTLYNRELILTVYDRNNQEVWQGSSLSTGSCSDLRDMMDYLLASSFQYFGHNTKRNVSLRINEKHPTVRWFKES